MRFYLCKEIGIKNVFKNYIYLKYKNILKYIYKLLISPMGFLKVSYNSYNNEHPGCS